MDLKSIKKTQPSHNPKKVVYGRHGVGKTSYAVGAPKPIFICTEDGLTGLSVDSFPLCETMGDILDCIAALHEPNDYKTVVLDSADWAEQLVWREVARQAGEKTVDSIPYGRGYTTAAGEFRGILDGLTSLSRRGMGVVVIAHSQIKRFDDPSHGDGYDRYQLKLHTKASALLLEWADMVGFATSETAVVKTGESFGQKQTRAISVGGRVIHWQPSPAFDAKCRYAHIPETLPLDWQSFELALKGQDNG